MMSDKLTLLATDKGFVEAVRKTITNRIGVLSSDDGSGMYAELEAFVNRTDRIVRAYNGRQIFEMLQNMDDQMRGDVPDEDRCSEVLLDKKNGTLSFRNNGCSFSFGGIVSILRPDISPKEKQQTIGNKGLGFRSLLNWKPRELAIRAGDIELVFSAVAADKVLAGNANLRRAVEALRNKGKELPILSFPEVGKRKGTKEWTTEIELRGLGENAIESIEKELREFRSETLLFLPNLREIKILIEDGETHRTVYSDTSWETIDEKNSIFKRTICKVVGDKPEEATDWLAFRQDGKLDAVQESGDSISKYDVAIAVPRGGIGWTDSRNLRNYLPVRDVVIELPCLVHATVALNDTRDGLPPDNPADKKIFEDILPTALKTFAEFLRDNAKKEFVKDRWFPWRLLSPPEKSPNPYVELLYDKLHSFCASGEFVPCVDGSPRTPNDSRYFAQAEDPGGIAAFFNKHTILLPNYILSTEQSPLPESFGDHPCKLGELETAINNAVASANLSDEELAELVHVLWRIYKIGGAVEPGHFLVLRDKSHHFFTAEETVYTPVGESRISLPDFMSRGFLSELLFKSICERFSAEIDAHRESHDGNPVRSFCRKEFKSIVDIEFYDKTAVTRQMVSECRRLLGVETDIAQKRFLVSQLLRALYDNFKTRADGAPLDEEVDAEAATDDEKGAETIDYRENLNLPVEVKDDGTIIEAGDLLFDSARQFYGANLGDEFYLDDNRAKELLGDTSEDTLTIHSFFRTFGVREDVRVRYAALSWQEDGDYLRFLVGKGENNGGLPSPSGRGNSLPENPRQICRLRDVDLVRGLSNEALLDLLVSSARKGLAAFLSEKPRINWKRYYGQNYGEVTVDWSYCAYQLVNSRQDLILEDIAQNMRKAEEEMAKKHQTLSLPLILERMGARRSLEDLSPEELYEKMAAFDRLDGVQKFYKRIRDALNKRLDRFEDDSPERHEEESKFAQLAREKLTTLWARKGNGLLERVERGKMRYWDNATISRNILADCWKLEIGHRVGAASVEKLFGVTNLDSASAKLLKGETEDAESLTKELADRLSARLVILLAIRCRDLSSQDEINRAASTLRLLPGIVHVVRRGAFLFEDRRYELGNGDLIQTENGFVICSTASDLKQALQSQSFCVAIGEMLGIRLRLADSLAIAAMRNAVKCSPEEMEMIRQSDLTESDWILATEALGLGEEEKRIWEARLGRALSPTEESELAILGSRAENIRRLIGTELSDGVPLDIPLGDMDNEQTDAFVRWLKVPTSALGVRTADKLRELRRARFKDFQRNGAIAGFVATELHRRLEQSTAEERRKYVPFVLRFQEDTDWFSDKLGKMLEGNPLADEAALWGVLTSSVLQAFAVQLPETAEGCKGSSQPDAGRTYLDILNETGMDLGGLDPLDRSLAFFPGNEEDFRKIVEDARRSEDAPTVPERDGTVPEEQGISIQRVSSVGDLPLSVFWSHRESSTPPRHSGKATHYLSDKRKRQIGKRAEEMVWKAINSDRETYQYPLPWSSLLNTQGTANDSLHYDISYQTPEGEERFVEVKAFDGHEFFMSSGEYEFAHSKEKRNKYVLALVDGNTIWFIEAPFASGSPFNGVLGHTASDYKFHFERLPPAAALPAPTESPQP